MSENEDVGVAPLNQAARDEQKESHEAKNEDLVDPTVTDLSINQHNINPLPTETRESEVEIDVSSKGDNGDEQQVESIEEED